MIYGLHPTGRAGEEQPEKHFPSMAVLEDHGFLRPVIRQGGTPKTRKGEKSYCEISFRDSKQKSFCPMRAGKFKVTARQIKRSLREELKEYYPGKSPLPFSQEKER